MREIQEQICEVMTDLGLVDEHLAELAERLVDDPEDVLAAELRGRIEVVRTDLLEDAIETLTSLAKLDASTAVRHYLEAADLLERAGQRIVAHRPTLNDPGALAQYLTERHYTIDQEILGAVYLDVQNRLIADVEIFRGTLKGTSVEPRVILREALERGASGFLLWHTLCSDQHNVC